MLHVEITGYAMICWLHHQLSAMQIKQHTFLLTSKWLLVHVKTKKN